MLSGNGRDIGGVVPLVGGGGSRTLLRAPAPAPRGAQGEGGELGPERLNQGVVQIHAPGQERSRGKGGLEAVAAAGAEGAPGALRREGGGRALLSGAEWPGGRGLARRRPGKVWKGRSGGGQAAREERHGGQRELCEEHAARAGTGTRGRARPVSGRLGPPVRDTPGACRPRQGRAAACRPVTSRLGPQSPHL